MRDVLLLRARVGRRFSVNIVISSHRIFNRVNSFIADNGRVVCHTLHIIIRFQFLMILIRDFSIELH